MICASVLTSVCRRTDMQTIDLATTTTLVPPHRLGEILRNAREDGLLSLAELERNAAGRFSLGDLRQLEAGSVGVSDDDVRAALALYGVKHVTTTRSVSQLVIDRERGELDIGQHHSSVADRVSDRQLLIQYLALVYRIRNMTPGMVFPTRTADLETLALVLGSTSEKVRSDLEELMLHHVTDIRDRSANLRSRFLLPAAGVLVAFTALGALLLSFNDNTATSRGTMVNIGDAMTIERSQSGAATGSNDSFAVSIEP